MEKTFVRVRSAKDITIFASLIVLGSVLVALPTSTSALQSDPESIDLGEADKGNAVKLDIYYSKSTGKAYLQLFEYVPYKYEPCSKMYEYEFSKVGKLLK